MNWREWDQGMDPGEVEYIPPKDGPKLPPKAHEPAENE